MSVKLGVLAGAGPMPSAVVAAARARGQTCFVVAFEGQTDPATVMDVEHAWVHLGQVGESFRRLREAGVGEICMIGPLRRPSIAELRPDWRAAQMLARAGLRAFGDDGLLSAIVKEIEAEGFRVVGADALLADLLARVGAYGRHQPSADDRIDIQRAIAVLQALGPVDVGQAVVVQGGLVLGVEAIEGTDALIARCGALRRGPLGGVLVKISKPGQERRVDLPTVGATTVEAAAAAGLAGIAIEAGRALVVNQAAVIAAADARGVFVIGIELPR